MHHTNQQAGATCLAAASRLVRFDERLSQATPWLSTSALFW